MLRYTSSRCGHCGQRIWTPATSTSKTEEERSADAAGVSKCRRCILSLTDSVECQICREACCDRIRYARVHNESWENQRCEHSFCRLCLYRYVELKLSDGVWNIRCPGVSCCYHLVEADLKRILEYKPVLQDPHFNSSQEVDFAVRRAEGSELLKTYRKLCSADHSAYLREVMRGLHIDGTREPPMHLADSEHSVDSVMPAPPPHFDVWALAKCQACPKCYIIVRKEEGCDHICCRCGEDFRYCCGVPCSQSCICKLPAALQLPRLGRWLLVKNALPWNRKEP